MNSSVPLQLPLHLGVEVVHLVLQVLGLTPSAIDLFVLAVQLLAHDAGALVPALGMAVKGGTVRFVLAHGFCIYMDTRQFEQCWAD